MFGKSSVECVWIVAAIGDTIFSHCCSEKQTDMRWKQLNDTGERPSARGRRRIEMNEWMKGGRGLAWENGNTAPWNYINYLINEMKQNGKKWELGTVQTERFFRVCRYHLRVDVFVYKTFSIHLYKNWISNNNNNKTDCKLFTLQCQTNGFQSTGSKKNRKVCACGCVCVSDTGTSNIICYAVKIMAQYRQEYAEREREKQTTKQQHLVGTVPFVSLCRLLISCHSFCCRFFFLIKHNICCWMNGYGWLVGQWLDSVGFACNICIHWSMQSVIEKRHRSNAIWFIMHVCLLICLVCQPLSTSMTPHGHSWQHHIIAICGN